MNLEKRKAELQEQHKLLTMKFQGAIELIDSLLEEQKEKKEKKK